MEKTLVLLNARAGTLIDTGVDKVVGQLREVLSGEGRDVVIQALKPRQMATAILRAARSDRSRVIVGGGDGSASLAAQAFAGSDRTLGVLPLGTVNLLARDLGMPADLDSAISALAKARARRIDLTRLNGRPFHSLSGLGFFSQMARAREETRSLMLGRFAGFGIAALRAMRRTGRFTLTVTADGRSEVVEASALLVTNNSFRPDWRRDRLDAGLLEVHIAQKAEGLEKLKTGASLLTGQWREDPGIRSFTAREITIGYGRPRTWAATDGELSRERSPLHYQSMPQVLSVLSPGGA